MNIETTWGWKTHQPMIHLMMTKFCPEYVMELGVGYNSTPLFLSYLPKKFVCIENDKEWLNTIVSAYPFFSTYSARYHSISSLKEPVSVSTKPLKLSDERKREIVTYYIALGKEVQEEGNPKLLFVDNHTCLRAIAISILGNYFDIIIYHDCQPEGVDWYGYYFDNQFDDYEFYLLKTPISWTGCYLRKGMGYTEQELLDVIQPYIQQFCKESGLELEMVWLEKQGK
jgi:hypothetical protein